MNNDEIIKLIPFKVRLISFTKAELEKEQWKPTVREALEFWAKDDLYNLTHDYAGQHELESKEMSMSWNYGDETATYLVAGYKEIHGIYNMGLFLLVKEGETTFWFPQLRCVAI